MTELIKAIDGIGASVKAMREDSKKDIHELRQRIEGIEAGRDKPTAVPLAPTAAYKRYEANGGSVFELPSHCKMSDVPELRGTKQPEISLERWLAATVAGERCGDKTALEFVREQKAMATTTTGVLIPAEYQTQWIDMLRARSVLNTAGMRTVTMNAKTQVHSAVTADPTASWHTEAASISAANPTFASRTLTATTLVTRCQASLELSQDSPDFGAQLAHVMTGAMAAEVDRAGLEGSGTPPTPTGIKNVSGRGSTTSIGALSDYSKIITGLGGLLAANADLAQISKYAVMSPGSWTALENLATGIASDKSQLARPRSIQDMQFLVTKNIAGNVLSSPQLKTTIYLGDFRDLLFGTRLQSSIEVLKLDTFSGNLILEFVGYLRGDFLVTRPASFWTLEGILA